VAQPNKKAILPKFGRIAFFMEGGNELRRIRGTEQYSLLQPRREKPPRSLNFASIHEIGIVASKRGFRKALGEQMVFSPRAGGGDSPKAF